MTDRSAAGRSWQARRTSGAAPILRSTTCSSALAAGRERKPRVTRTRQVEQRPRPPQTEAWGMAPKRLTSSSV